MSGKQSSYTVYKTYYTACQSSPGAGDLMAGYYYYNYEPVSRLMKADFIQYQGAGQNRLITIAGWEIVRMPPRLQGKHVKIGLIASGRHKKTARN